ncbi:TIGR03118 family protein [Niveibacterium sp. SC-1]|uniref:TIGR03118 family protein n=1 Tax=Niveibacterium sp. SC-1 TaxID=3135646 RepID=UPI00311EF22B
MGFLDAWRGRIRPGVLGVAAAAALLAACGGGDGGSTYNGGGMGGGGGGGTGGSGMDYALRNIVSDTPGGAYAGTHTDTHLVNPWGIAFNPQGFVWVSNAGTSTSTLYDGEGNPQSLVVSIPPGASGDSEPAGIVFSGGTDFVVTQNGLSGPSRFIFASGAGTLSGWAPGANMANAIKVYDGGATGQSFKGLALAAGRLYAADFGKGTVDVFDGSFAPTTVAGGFADPTLPAAYAPFGIQAVGSEIFVAYAQRGPTGDETKGVGLGALTVFDTNGNLLRRLVSPGGALNAPWGIAMAPGNFGRFSNALLVGNFGDGHINAFNPNTGALLGSLSTTSGVPLAVDGLWGIAFGNGLNSQPTNTLFFAGGPADETHGVYGRIDVN